jgi:putative peptidoglycan lipid II flippase
MSNDNDKVARAAGVVGLATLASRLLGAVRDMVIASVFGTGLVSDAFFAAFRLPNLLRRLFGEGSLSVALVPIFSDCLIGQGRGEARRLASICLRLLTLLLIGLTVIGLVFAPLIVHILAPGFSRQPEKFALTVQLTRMMTPFVFFIGLVALCMAILNVFGHFAAPAAAPVFLNVCMILSVPAAQVWGVSEIGQAQWLAASVVVGGGMQLILQLPFLFNHQIRFWRGSGYRHERLKQILLSTGPVLLGAAVFQINSLVITLLATLLPQGSISYLYYADRLIQFPLGIFAMAAATAVLPTLSRQASAGQWEELRGTFTYALRLVIFITLPAMVGLIVLRIPIVTLLFQRGAFDAASTRLTADALLYYGLGLWSFSALRIVLSLFYAMRDVRTPLRIGAVSIGANLLLALALMGPMRHAGLALALSLASTLNLILLIGALRQKMGALRWSVIVVSAGRVALCAATMGAAVWGLARWLLPLDAGGGALLIGTGGCMICGTLVFGAGAYLLRLPEIGDVWGIFSKK